ncbi:dihydrodipicolinate synthase family protein [Spelaeicoccus albus]|uniref:dihydrodipicolinate synthase family protein n=1 Tax=Spelaeicoccus albus TaxID=1280376 RepID=UPI0015CC6BC6|nr:dihydrodipicolinate synthase family protein [Spelaeicoccus albus]
MSANTNNHDGPLAPGVWGVVPTPFAGQRREVDAEGLGRLAVFFDDAGATGLTVLGVFGEASSLNASERAHVLRTVAEHSKLAIVAGITSIAAGPAIAEIENAQTTLGPRLRAVMVQVNSARSQDVIEHLQSIHASSDAPIVLQDYPKSSGITISTSQMITITKHCPFVCAVKSEAPPTAVAIARLTANTDLSVFGGLGGQGLLDELTAGSAGAMTGFSYPEALVACVSAWRRGDRDVARAELLPYMPLINFEQQPGIALAIRKELFRRRGIFNDAAVRAPAAEFPPELAELAAAHLEHVETEAVIR